MLPRGDLAFTAKAVANITERCVAGARGVSNTLTIKATANISGEVIIGKLSV